MFFPRAVASAQVGYCSCFQNDAASRSDHECVAVGAALAGSEGGAVGLTAGAALPGASWEAASVAGAEATCFFAFCPTL
jgi:hypothetical protein